MTTGARRRRSYAAARGPRSFDLPGWVACVGYVKRAFVPRIALLVIGLVVGLAGPPVQAAPFAYKTSSSRSRRPSGQGP
jgi:hypothetical protein